uniref:Uncharacterized protein n=1 Tax=Acrobeloides nanus TaxID=290746 RepID=A0A914D3C0_9BILA
MKFFIAALFCFVIIDTMAYPVGDKASSDDDHVMVVSMTNIASKYLFRWSVRIQSVSKKAVFHLVVQFLVVLQKNVQDYVQCTDGQILVLFKSL